jgi:hypothetical protein
MSSKTKRWVMAVLAVALVLIMGSALALPGNHDTVADATFTGPPIPAVVSGQAGSTTGQSHQLKHDDEHEHEHED